MPRFTPLLALPPALLAASCVSPENDRTVIDQDLRLEVFTPVPPSTIPPAPPPTPPPSVVSIDRSNWAKVTFLIPVDGTAHHPAYTKRVVLSDKTARQRREYPTATSALDVTGGSESEQQLEVPANWLISLGDVLLLPLRLLWQAPWTTRWSPDEAYARYWHPERPEAPPPPPAPAAAPPPPPPATPPPPASMNP